MSYKPLSLRRNFLWTLVGNVFYSACQWGMLIVLTKLGNAKIVGQYGLAMAISIPIAIFGKLQLQAVFVTDTQNEYPFRDYLTLRIFAAFAAIIVTAIIAMMQGSYVENVIIIIIVAVGQGVISVREMYLTVMQKAERMDAVSISNSVQGMLSLIFFFIVFWTTRNLIYAATSLLIARILTMGAYDIPLAKRLLSENGNKHGTIAESCRRWRNLLKLVWMSLPIGITAALISLNTNIPQYLIKYYYNETILGYYVPMVSLIAAGNLIIAALGQSACPRLAQYFALDKKAYRTLLIKLVVFGFAVGLIGFLIAFFAGKTILSILFSPEYVSYYKEFNWLMIAGAITYVVSFLGYGLTAARYFKVQLLIWMFIAALTTLTGWFLIPGYAIIGAAWSISVALVVGAALIIILTIFILRRRIPDNAETVVCDNLSIK